MLGGSLLCYWQYHLLYLILEPFSGAIAEKSQLIRAGYNTLKLTDLAASKAVRFIKITARILVVLSFALDGIMTIYAAIEGAKQKTELQKSVTLNISC